ncbi:hypothetical protein Acsp05_43890 [Actinokineospora sp. NBRC 105648]|nr:hypothetical protein Acsp05_43890 [Actinokineospora sp. NBRC 105648]
MPLGSVDLLTPAERDLVLSEWNDTGATVSAPSIPDLFATRVAADPDGVAVVVDGGETLSYRELDARVAALATVLVAHGVGPGAIVGVLLERSAALVVALLAVQRAGAAYLPLDPEYPAERLRLMVADAAPALVIAAGSTSDFPARVVVELDGHVASVVAGGDDGPGGVGGALVCPQAELSTGLTAGGFAASSGPGTLEVGCPPGRAGAVQGVGDDLGRSEFAAYVIYTSGSTGRPKGVVVGQSGIVNRLLWMQGEYGLVAGERVLQKTPASFDVSVWEFFWPLVVGATLVVARPGGHRDPAYLAGVIERHGVSTVHFVPSMLRAFVAEPAVREVRSLRRVLCSGEALPADLRDEFFAVSDAELHNLYGPTEASVDVTAVQVQADRATVPIGRPVWNTRVYVLDAQLRPAPIGVVGELYLAGVQLAWGYLKRPGLTAERFVADPFGSGERLYRTGDLALWSPDGVVEYVGRADDQVKLRGFRIELGEVEAALSAVDGVAHAVAAVRDDRLVGYVVPRGSGSRVREDLARVLPAHLVPSVVVELDEIPLTPSGKTDRKALPDPQSQTGASFVAPRDAAEELLSAVFVELLGVPEVGVHDDFFALGGHSLLATRLVNRARVALGAELSVRDVFDAPTVADLAARTRGARTTRLSPGELARPELAPLSAAQQRLWFAFQVEGPSPTYNIPFTARLFGQVDVEALRAALADLATRHESLRTVLHDTHQEITAALPELHVVRLTEAELPAHLTEAAEHAFDLAADIPVRAWLFITETASVLLVLVHHVAADEWSEATLWSELGTAYAARRSGSAPEFAPLAVQYADYAVWQRAVLDDGLAEAQLAYWRHTLDGAPAEIPLPTDRSRPAVPDHRGARVSAVVSPDTHRALAEVATRSGATLFMVGHAALAALLTAMGAGHDVVLGAPVAGRADDRLDGLIGFLVNTVVLRTETSGDPTFAELLARVRSTDLAAYAHQDVPFDRVVDELAPERALGRNPLFQTMLVHRTAPTARPGLPGHDGVVEPVRLTTAKVDLTVTLAERAEGGIDVSVDYATQLFDEATAADLASRLIRLLDTAAADPGIRLSTVDVRTAAERAWPVEAVPVAVDPATIPELLDLQVRARPDEVAVVADQTLTFAQLGSRVRALARHLVELGVRPETVVAVALPRTVDLVVALFAVLEAGAVYLPLDPDYPRARLDHVLADAAPALLITDSLEADIPMLRPDDPAIASATADLPRHPDPDSAAYVIYTSGSTGEPKGVTVAHRQIATLFHANRAAVFTPVGRARVAHGFSFAFDASWQALLWLLDGHQLHLLTREEYADPAAFRAVVVERGITFVEATPATIAMLVDEGLLGYQVRGVAMGGEAVPAALWERLSAADVHAFNFYGPTETTVMVTMAEINGSQPTLGDPVAGTTAFVLDVQLRPAPTGVVGELYVGGAQVARGYRGRPSLTACRFVANPFGPGRIYRTGDLVRRTRDGALRFVGRADDQVKVRGFRVELGEVEAALSAVPGVRAAVVVLREGRLVGYVTPADLDVSALRAAVSARLPEQAVPGAVVALAELPLTANGKVNRAALPAPDFAAQTSSSQPRTPAETALAGVFAAVLGLPSVGVDDDFFALGGDSILSIQLVTAARAAGFGIGPRDVFEQRTVAALALLEDDSRPTLVGSAVGVSPFTPVMRDFLARGGPVRKFAQTVVLATPADLTADELFVAVQRVLDTHGMLRARLGSDGLHVPPSLRASDVLRVGELSVEEAVDALDPEDGRMVALRWDGVGRLLIAAHHLAVDGVSWRVLAADLADARVGELAPETTPFRVWAEELSTTRWADGDFWADLLAQPVRPWGTVPVDPTRDVLGATRMERVVVDVATTRALLTELPQRHRAGVREAVLTALAVAAGGPVRVDVEGHGREEKVVPGADLTRTVGWFTTVHPLRLEPSLAAVKEHVRAVPDNGIGHGWLPTRDVGEVLVNYLGRFSVEDRPWAPVADGNAIGGGSDPELPVSHAVTLNCAVEDRPDGPTLVAEWTYAPDACGSLDVPELAASWASALAGLVEQPPQLTPSDFPLVDLDPADLAGIVSAHPSLTDVWPLSPLQAGLLYLSEVDDSDVYVVQLALTLAGTVDPDRLGSAVTALLERHANLRTAFLVSDSGTPVQVVTPLPTAPTPRPAGQQDLTPQQIPTPERIYTLEQSTPQTPTVQPATPQASTPQGPTPQTPTPQTPTPQAHPPRGPSPIQSTGGDRQNGGSGSSLWTSGTASWVPLRLVETGDWAGFLAEDRARRFDVGAPPLVRFALVRTPGAQRLVITSHHIVLDGWSGPLLVRDLIALYAGVELPPVRPYRDYLAALPVPDTAVWAEALDGLTEPTLLAPDTAVAGVPDEVTVPVTADLAEIARARRVTVNTLVQAAWGLVLARVLGRDDVVFGATVSGRSPKVPGIADMVGLFINTVPVRVRFNPAEPTGAFLTRLQSEQAALLDHQDVGLADIQRVAGIGELFDTLVVFESYPIDSRTADASFRVTAVEGHDATHYPVALVAHPGGDLRLRHQPGTRDLAADLARRLATVLDAFAGDRVVGTIDVLTDTERELVLRGFNDTAEPEVSRTLAEMLTTRMAATPESIAVVDGARSLTYGELDRHTAALADHLRATGIGPERTVGIALPRSAEMVVALVAVLRAGGAFVPVDPTWPADRRDRVTADARATVAITGPNPVPLSIPTLPVDLENWSYAPLSTPTQPQANPPQTNPRPPRGAAPHPVYRGGAGDGEISILPVDNSVARTGEVGPGSVGSADEFAGDLVGPARQVGGALGGLAREVGDSGGWGDEFAGGLVGGVDAVDGAGLAYVIFTSGSTGVPKGAMIRHEAICARLSWQVGLLGFGADDATLFKAPLAFDISVNEIFLPLVAGGRVVVAKAGGERDPNYLLDVIDRERVTFVYLPSSMLDALLAVATEPAALAGLRHVWCGGEVLTPDLFDRFRDRLDTTMYHGYGPAEATIGVSHVVYRDTAERIATSIGKPNPNTRLYVLDPHMRPVPVGRTGELYAGGYLLGRGYVGAPGLTAARFVADPYGPAGARLYRTGDLARWNADGSLDFVGRADNQVKIRGMRLELEEVESALSAHPAVRRAVVTVRKSPAPYLAAYVVPEQALSVDELAGWAKSALPEYMVPSAFVLLDSLPTTVNGKVDRAALPEPDRAVVITRAPRDAAEAALASLVAAVLGLPEVGADDDFFTLGGDSIVSMQLVARARAAEIRLTTRQVFEARTVAEMARVAEFGVAVRRTDDSAVGVIPLTPVMRELVSRGGPINRFHQSRLVTSPAELTLDRLVAAVDAVVAAHPVLRARFTGDSLVVGAEPAADVVTRVDAAGVYGPQWTDRLAVAAEAAVAALDPAVGRVLQVVWFDRGPGEPGRLLVVAHHFVIDGVSWRVLIPALASATRGERLEPAAVSFRGWATATRARAADLEVEREAWERIVLPGASLSTRALDPTTDTVGLGQSLTVRIPDAQRLITGLPALFHTGATEVLLAGLAWAAGETLVVDVEGHGRAEVAGLDPTDTVGWFTEIHPVRLELGADVSATLKRVKDAVRAVPGDGLGFGLLDIAAPRRDVLFNYLGRIGVGESGEWAGAPEAATLAGGADLDLPVGHPIAVNVLVEEGADGPVLVAHWAWVGAVADATVRGLADRWAAALGELAQRPVGGHSPSDWPLAGLTQDEVDEVDARHPDVADVWPTTPLQAGLLFLSRFDESTVDVYTTQQVLSLTGEVDGARLRAAAQALVDRHDTLRASFPALASGTVAQVIARRTTVPWRQVTADETETARLVDAERATRFDLAAGPLLRFLLIRLGPDTSRLVLTNHHAILDGWSTPLLARELFALYAGDSLPAVPPYRSHLADLATRDGAAAETAWRTALAGLDEPTIVAPDAARAGVLPEQLDIDLPAEVTARLTAAVRRVGVTVNAAVQAAWGLVLSQWTGRRDVVFGATVSGRDGSVAGAESMVGLFINTVPVRVRLDPAEPLGELLARLHREQSALLDHQHVGLADIQRVVGIGELFDTLTVFESYPVDSEALARAESAAGLVVTEVVGRDATHYPLTLLVLPGASTTLTLRFRPDVVGADAANALLRRVARALETIADDLGRPVHAVDLLPAAERDLVVRGWQGAAVELPATTIPALFAARAAADPDGVALVVDGGASLSYRELAARVDALALVLREHGVVAGTIVGVSLERSAALVVALLAVQRAGAAYLPLDPEYPAERLAMMIADARPVVVVAGSAQDCATVLVDDHGVALSGWSDHDGPGVGDRAFGYPQGELSTGLTGGAFAAPGAASKLEVGRPPGRAGAALGVGDDLGSGVDGGSWLDGGSGGDGGRGWVGVGGESGGGAAYVIYTSGSTGRPKGVVVGQSGIVNRLLWMQGEYGLARGERVLQKTPASFDVSVWEFFWPLVVGATLVVAKPGGHRDPAYLAEVIERHSVTTVHFVPSMLRAFVPVALQAKGLRRVLCSGEALPDDLRDEFVAVSGAELHNLYGPTEASVDVTATRVDVGRVSIGRPVWNTRLYVLDGFLRPVPVGGAGELYLAGVQLARGYLNRPGLTAERFVADPFNKGQRLYRTGDVARWHPDGSVDYLGRADEQVKLRGFRIELGEIEAALSAVDGVERAVVVVRDDRLIGYLVGSADHDHANRNHANRNHAEHDDVREALRRVLPEHMVPSAFVTLEQIPLTPSGKTDRKALPDPDFAALVGDRAAESDVERTLAELVAAVLGLPNVGVDDDFFTLGGDSIVSIQLVARARAAGLRFSSRDVFERRTVAGLALVVEVDAVAAVEEVGASIGLVPFTPIMRDTLRRGGPIAKFAQARLLNAPKDLDLAKLEQAVTALLDTHHILRARLTDEGLEVPEHATAPDVSRIDATGRTDEELASAVADELDPRKGVMLRVVWLDRAGGQGKVLLVAHHLVVDGVSWRVLEPDLVKAYRGEPLDPIGTSFRQWAIGLRASNPDGEHWRSLADCTGQVLASRPITGADTVHTGREFKLELTTEETLPLLTTLPDLFHGTVNDVLLAGLALAIAHTRGNLARVVDVEGHGREEQAVPGTELSRTVGWFTTVYPVRLDLHSIDVADALTGGHAAGEAVKRVKEHLRAIPDNGIGFGLGDHDLPPRDVLVNYLGRFDIGAEQHGDWAGTGLGGAVDPELPISHALQVNAITLDGPDGPRLSATWAWGGAVVAEPDARELAHAWFDALRALARHAEAGAGGHTPSDLTFADLSQDELDEFDSEWSS